MIKDPPLLKVKRNFPRPSAAVIRALHHVPTGFLVDCMDGRGALDYQIKPLDIDVSKFAGPVVTCHTGPNDNLAVFGALEIAQPGDVLIIATDSFRATCVAGDMMLGMVRNGGLAAFVTDGLVRDVEGILPSKVPTFCAGVTPNSCVRNGPGTVGLPVVIGGVSVQAGDIAVGDRDGVVIVPQDRLAQVQESLKEVLAAEDELARKVRLGLKNIEPVQELMNSDRTEYLD